MFKILENGKSPTKGTKHSACVDLYASHDCTIGAGETNLVGLGVAIDLDKLIENSKGMFHESSFDGADEFTQSLFNDFLNSHYLQLMLRSSLSKHLVIANGVGVIDLDYKDEIKIRLENTISEIYQIGDNDFSLNNSIKISKGDKIAQITLLEHKSYLFGIESEFERDGGFGSTGK